MKRPMLIDVPRICEQIAKIIASDPADVFVLRFNSKNKPALNVGTDSGKTTRLDTVYDKNQDTFVLRELEPSSKAPIGLRSLYNRPKPAEQRKAAVAHGIAVGTPYVPSSLASQTAIRGSAQSGAGPRQAQAPTHVCDLIGIAPNFRVGAALPQPQSQRLLQAHTSVVSRGDISLPTELVGDIVAEMLLGDVLTMLQVNFRSRAIAQRELGAREKALAPEIHIIASYDDTVSTRAVTWYLRQAHALAKDFSVLGLEPALRSTKLTQELKKNCAQCQRLDC